MTEPHPQQAIAALGDAYQAAQRLAEAGLANDEDGGNRGLNTDGIRTLTDLCTILMMQTQSGTTHAERTTGATARAMLSTVGDLYRLLGGGTDKVSNDTLRLLRTATKTAREG